MTSALYFRSRKPSWKGKEEERVEEVGDHRGYKSSSGQSSREVGKEERNWEGGGKKGGFESPSQGPSWEGRKREKREGGWGRQGRRCFVTPHAVLVGGGREGQRIL
eukprot:354075-Chlamydomonas_euryale.AAC.2